MSLWLTQTDLENATTVATVLGCFDDANTGTVSSTALDAVIDRAEQEVMSWLVAELGPPPITGAKLTQLQADTFLKYAAVEYAVYYMYDRAPETVRQSSGDQDKRYQGAVKRMERILDARQRPPTVATPPANVGGVSFANLNRIFADAPNGPVGGNAGDF
jgi:hypothetical protein